MTVRKSLKSVLAHATRTTAHRLYENSLRALFALSMVCIASELHAQTMSDVRVVIDVSGSMKQNDPKNLRSPALRLLVELMPEGTRSGVWTFGQYVDMPVPLNTIDKTWRDKAREEAKKIHSRGLYTNIEEAVRKASTGWQTPDPKFRRHMILLTDGMVDVSKDAQQNAASRKRLLEEVLPALKQADATVHTIALSEQADDELLQAISSSTSGAFEKVKNAEDLQRIFLRLFEKSVDADVLPIADNKFNVDKNIKDMTVLVFLAADSPPTQLTLPSQKKWTQQSHPENVQWHHEQGYDLITVRTPENGEWALQANVDPDNRVLVVTNLRMQVDKLPNIMLLGDPVEVRARLLEEGKTITNVNFLDKTKFEIKQVDSQDKGSSIGMKDDGIAPDVIKGDGVYAATLDTIKQAGEYELIVQAKSLTFQREAHHSLHVYDSPANIVITQTEKDKPFHVSIKSHAGLIRPATVSMQIRLPEGEPMILSHVNDEEWSVDVPAEHAGKVFTLTLAATRYDDKPIKATFEQVLSVTHKPHSLAMKITAPAVNEAEQVAQNVEGDSPEETDETNSDGVTEEDTSEKSKGFNWKVVISLIVGVNVLIFGGGYLGYRIIKKRRKKQAEADAKEMQV